MTLLTLQPRIAVTNPVTGEYIHRVQWSRDHTSITVYTNFGLWKVFTGRQAQMVNAAFVAAMNEVVKGMEMEKATAEEGNDHGA